jgi:phage-related protein
MHSDLTPVANLLIKAAMGMVCESGTKIMTIVMPSFPIFKDVTRNLLNDFQPV